MRWWCASRGSEVAVEALIAHCKTLIAGYKCPRSVDFVDALPLSGAGKVLKTKLREPFWQGRERASPEPMTVPISQTRGAIHEPVMSMSPGSA